MGFASYFEDIIGLRDEAFTTTSSMAGPAGLPPTNLPASLVACYSRLRTYCDRIAPQIVARYNEGQWGQLSSEMDSLEAEIRQFDNANSSMSQSCLMSAYDSLSKGIETTQIRAKGIISFLDAVIPHIEKELATLQRLKKQVGDAASKAHAGGWEQQARQMVEGWRELTSKSRQFHDKADDLQILLLSDRVLDGLMENADAQIPDNDAECN